MCQRESLSGVLPPYFLLENTRLSIIQNFNITIFSNLNISSSMNNSITKSNGSTIFNTSLNRNWFISVNLISRPCTNLSPELHTRALHLKIKHYKNKINSITTSPNSQNKRTNSFSNHFKGGEPQADHICTFVTGAYNNPSSLYLALGS